MLAAAIIVFREILEAALIVGIVMAASRGAPGRGVWVAGGVAAGTAGALAVAGFAGALSAAASGIGQELFDAAVLFAAVAMLGWHNIWMSRHGRDLTAAASRLGTAVRSRRTAALGAGNGGWLGGPARGLGDGAVPLRHRSVGRWRHGGAGAWRRDRNCRRRPRRSRDLCRPCPHSSALSVCRDQLARFAAGRRHGVPSRRFPAAGRSFAVVRRQSVGYLVPAERARV